MITVQAINTIQLEESLKEYKKRIFMKQDQYIYREGEHGNGFYYIDQGLVAITTSTNKGNERLLNIAGPGQFLGVQGIFEHQYLTNALAVRNSILYRFSFEEFVELINENNHVIHLITDSMKHNSEILLQNLFLSTMSAKTRIAFVFQIFLKNLQVNEIEMTPTEIARYTGLTRVRVHQVLREWEEERIVHVENGTIIVNDFDYFASLTSF